VNDPTAARLDLRLMPAAVTAWVVTAAAIGWRAGPVLAASCAAAGLAWWVAARRTGSTRMVRSATAAVTAAAAVGAGFAVAGALRSDAVDQHPITERFGASAAVTVAATGSPRPAGGGRLMFPADLIRVGGQPAAGRVIVFGGAGLGALSAGQPASFTARIGRPARRDLTVAVLRVSGHPDLGAAPGPARAAGAVRTGFAAAARRVLPADQAAILPGLVLGDTSAVDSGTVAAFRTAGLTHLTAVSGANVTIVCGSVLLAAGLLGPRVAVVLAGATLVAFVVVVQPEASVLRAAVIAVPLMHC
jgi:competence protein ComEC